MSPRTPLLRPDRFFAERELNGLRLLLVAVVLVLSGPATVAGVGYVLTDRVDGTVAVGNPARPSEGFCESAPASVAADAGCGEPPRVERDVDAVLWEAVDRVLAPAFLAAPLWVLVVAGVLHGGSWLLDAEGGAAESVAVALWGTVPSLVAVVVLLGATWLTFDPVAVTPETDPSALVESARTELRPVERLAPVVGTGVAVWSGAIWRFGLEHERGLSAPAATGIAGSAALLSLFVTLA